MLRTPSGAVVVVTLCMRLYAVVGLDSGTNSVYKNLSTSFCNSSIEWGDLSGSRQTLCDAFSSYQQSVQLWLVVALLVTPFLAITGCEILINKNPFFLRGFLVFTAVIMLGLSAAAIGVFVTQTTANREVLRVAGVEFPSEVFDYVSLGNTTGTNRSLLMLDVIQTQLQCCGFSGPLDYAGARLPASCYATAPSTIYGAGCLATLSDLLTPIWFKPIMLALIILGPLFGILLLAFRLWVLYRNKIPGA